jgi:hypothetical protein
MGITREKSELQRLLEKNAYGEGLTPQEREDALNLIAHPVFSEKHCWVCAIVRTHPNDMIENAIFDTGLCQRHASYALVTQK